jgi:hypothetical protein
MESPEQLVGQRYTWKVLLMESASCFLEDKKSGSAWSASSIFGMAVLKIEIGNLS